MVEELADRMKQVGRSSRAAPGQLTVLDTNVLLHFQPPDQIDWPASSVPRGAPCSPARVMEELDVKKYTARDNLADRARRLLSQLRTQLAPTQLAVPYGIREDVTIEVPVEDGPRRRTWTPIRRFSTLAGSCNRMARAWHWWCSSLTTLDCLCVQ